MSKGIRRDSPDANRRDPESILQGTLDMLVLRAVALAPMHGWGIAERIEQWSEDVLALGQGTLYPGLYRLERRGLISSKWGTTENNRRARYYTLTPAGRKQLTAEIREFERVVTAIRRVIQPA